MAGRKTKPLKPTFPSKGPDGITNPGSFNIT